MHRATFLSLLLLPATLSAKTVTLCVRTCGGGYSTQCLTAHDISSVDSISTVYSTLDVPVTSTIEITETLTIPITVTSTPGPVSSTTTQTLTSTITAANITDVFTDTITTTETDSTTTTITITETPTTSVTTTTTSTSTIGTPTSWLPIADTTASAYPAVKKREALPLSPMLEARTADNATVGLLMGAGATFPKKVSCQVTSIITETRHLTRTQEVNSTTTVPFLSTATATLNITGTLALPTITSCFTSTVTTTTTIPPKYINSTTSITTTSTTTLTFTDTLTSTTTATTSTLTATATATYNAACAPDNIMNTFIDSNGNTQGLDNLFNSGPDAPTSYTIGSAGSPYSCCDLCFNTAGCTGSVWGGGTTCLLIQYGTSSAQQCVQSENPAYYTYDQIAADSSPNFYVSNGLCGYNYRYGS